MRRSRLLTHKKVSIPEEDEEERVKKTESKKAIIRAEFEKHKKELEINVTEASKMNEIKLKNQLEELLTINARKQENLRVLENSEHNLEKQNLEATQFFETVSRFEMSKEVDPYLSVGYHPNRTTASIFGMNENNVAEMLGDKVSKLMETLSNIELLIEEEDKVCSSVHEKYSELKKDHILSSKKVNELAKMNDHANKRFTDLQRIEFLAWNKQAAAASDLKEFKAELKDFKDQETSYKRQKEDEKKRETEYLIAKENEMSNVLIELDRKKIEFQQKQEDIKKLDLKYEEMRDKRKNNKIVTKYIETFNALDEKRVNLVAAHQALREISERIDASRENSPYKFIPGKGENGASAFTFNFEETPSRPDTAEDMPKAAPVKRHSLLDRNNYIERIQKLYEKHPEGPQKLADALIQEYMDQCYHEESLKSNYEELQNNKRKQEHELQCLEEELKLLKGKNEYITLGRTGSKILDSNEQEAIDSGMVIIDSQPTTLNQAKFEFENKKEADNDANLFTATESFVLRCYMDSIEMISRFSKLLASIYYQSGGYLSEEIKEMSRLSNIQLSMLKRSKKLKLEMSASQVMAEVLPELQRTITENTSTSEKERDPQEPIVTLDLLEVKEAFLVAFDEEDEMAVEFIEKLKDDVMIISFATIEDIKSYLEACQTDHFTQSNIQRVLAKTDKLRGTAIKNMMQKFETIYKLYAEINLAAQQSRNDVSRYLRLKGVQAPKEDFMGKEADCNPFIQKAIQKKWKNLLERYDYDPNRDYRVEVPEKEGSELNTARNLKEKAEMNDELDDEIWDREDTKAKLNEIVGAKSRKIIFKGKIEEDQKRLQAKKEKEKQRQALENMTDDDFFEWQRKQIKKDGKDDLVLNEMNEAEMLRKYQADQALRLSASAAPIEELRRMIENSKVLAKIQILEKQKGATDGKRNLKYEPTENYIPHEPIKVPKSPPHSANQTSNLRYSRTSFATANQSIGKKFFGTSSDGLGHNEYGDTPKDLSYKSGFAATVSKFKPIDAQFNFNSEPNAEYENLHTASKRLRTLDNFKGMPLQNEAKEPRSKKFLIESAQKCSVDNRDSSSTRNKLGKVDLPKLEKKTKKKNEMKKKRKPKHGTRLASAEHETLNNLLQIQTDPLLKMVYSPTFFANSVPVSAYSSEEMGYKFDSFKFNASGLLV